MAKMTPQEASELRSSHATMKAAARAAGIPYTSFKRLVLAAGPQAAPESPVADAQEDKPATRPAAEPKAKKFGHDVDEFRALYDKDYIVPRKIRDTLANLAGWAYESDFAREAHVSMSDLNVYRDQFAEHVVQVKSDGRRVWARTKDVADKLRNML